MIRRLFFGFLIVLFSCTSKSKDNDAVDKNDSIKKYLDLAANDTLNLKLRNKYNDKAFSLIDLSKNDTLTRFYLSSLSFNYMLTKNWNSLNKTGKIHFEKSITSKDTLNIARYYKCKADYFRINQIHDSAFYYYVKAEKFYKKTFDKVGLAKVMYGKSMTQLEFDDYLGAELSSNQAYYYCKKEPVNRFTLQILTNQGIIANNLQNYDEAIEKYKKCIYYVEKYNFKNYDFHFKRTCLNNIGNSYRQQNKYHQAITYFKKVLKEKKLENSDCELYALSMNNIGFCYMKLNNNKELPGLFLRARKIFKDINNKSGYIYSDIYLSQYYLKNTDTLNAQFYASEALKISKQSDSPYYYLTALSNAGSVSYKNAPEYIKEYDRKIDSLLFVERKTKNQYYNIQFQTNEIIREKETAIKQKWIIGGIGIVFILITILLLVITRQHSKQKELQFLQSQQKTNEEIYNLMLTQKSNEELARQNEKQRIAIELHDGVMNKLASARLNLNVLTRKKDNETIEKCIGYIEDIYKIEQEIRNISHDLNTEVFNDYNSFTSLLNDFVSSQNDSTTTHYELEIDKYINWISISSSIKMNLYRIIQEGSHNINKFAQAENAIISFIIDENNLCLSIIDNGKGFDTQISREGIGLKNIKQRVESLNGKLVVKSIKGESTSLNIAIPIS